MYKKRKQLEYRQSQLLGGEPAVVDVAGLNYKRCLAIEVPQISAGKSVENKGKQAFEAVTGRWMDCNTHILATKILHDAKSEKMASSHAPYRQRSRDGDGPEERRER